MSDTKRLVSLDVFRGMTIAGMVLVNNPGGSPVYWPLEHAEWNGLTPTDWIFPFFLFIVGVSITMSLGKIGPEEKGVAYRRIFTRAASIYLLGAALSILPFFQFRDSDAPDILKLAVWLLFCASLFLLLLRKYWIALGLIAAGLAGIGIFNLLGYNIIAYNYGTLRIMGVLQRIAVVYLITSIIFLNLDWKQMLGLSAVILFGYWLLMTMIDVPGCELTTINDKACNLAAYIDRVILTEDHIWRGGKVYDPEGLLSTLPAMVTCISGVLTGKWLTAKGEAAISKTDPVDEGDTKFVKVSAMFFFGAVLLSVGYIWNSYFAINKALWTSSYVFATTGLALLVLACCYWLIDIYGYRKWAKPFEIFGVNAMTLFVFSGFFARIISSYRVDGPEGKPISLSGWVMQNVFLPVFQPIDASLAFAITFILIWLFLMWLLYRRRIFVRV